MSEKSKLSSIVKASLQLKLVHELLTVEKQLAYSNVHINSETLREIRNISLDLVDITFEINELQEKRYGKEGDQKW